MVRARQTTPRRFSGCCRRKLKLGATSRRWHLAWPTNTERNHVSVAIARPFTTLPASSRLRGRPFSSPAPPVFLNLYPEYRNQPIPRVPYVGMVGIYYVQKGRAVAWRAPDRRTCRRQPTLTIPRAKEYPNGISLLRESESSLVLPPVTERFLFPTRFPR